MARSPHATLLIATLLVALVTLVSGVGADAGVLATGVLSGVVAELRGYALIPSTVTDSQISNQIRLFVESTGNNQPTMAELRQWLKANAGWYQG